MNIQPTDQQAQSFSSDDQELAKVLAGVNQSVDGDQDVTDTPEEQMLPTPPTPMPEAPQAEAAPAEEVATETPAEEPEQPLVPPTPMPEAPAPNTPPANVDPALDSIKQEALGELRPLVDKLNVSPEEKFDTYLLLLRSTDDKELIAPAHQAAKDITDEARKAQALLDIIKEIDFLSQGQ